MKKILFALLLGSTIIGCEKPDVGFFSENGIKMKEDTVVVNQGIVVTTGIPMIDGTSRPLEFELITIKNLITGETMGLKTYELSLWKEAFDAKKDTTMTLVNKKLYKKSVAPVEVNPACGQLQFNAGTSNLEAGLYGLDVRATNSKSSKVFENFCIFKLVSNPWQVVGTEFGDTFNGIPAEGEKGRVGLTPATARYSATAHDSIGRNIFPTRKLTKIAEGNMITLIMVVRGSDGKPFAGKDIGFWPTADGSYNNNYHDNSLALNGEKVELTDTSCVFHFPTTPYPGYSRNDNSATGRPVVYYSIDMKVCGMPKSTEDLIKKKEAELGVKFVAFSPRFKNSYQINELGTWLLEVTNPYVYKK